MGSETNNSTQNSKSTAKVLLQSAQADFSGELLMTFARYTILFYVLFDISRKNLPGQTVTE